MSGEMEESIVAEDVEVTFSHGNIDTRSSLPQALWRKSVAPVKSLKRVNFANAAGQLLLFGAKKVAALEAVRRISQARCRPLWWGLQGIFTIQAPPFNWLQRWSPFQHVAQATQEETSVTRKVLSSVLATGLAITLAGSAFAASGPGGDGAERTARKADELLQGADALIKNDSPQRFGPERGFGNGTDKADEDRFSRKQL